MFSGLVRYLRDNDPAERPYRLLIIGIGIACLTLISLLALSLWLLLSAL
jgi:hypothetical protein